MAYATPQTTVLSHEGSQRNRDSYFVLQCSLLPRATLTDFICLFFMKLLFQDVHLVIGVQIVPVLKLSIVTKERLSAALLARVIKDQVKINITKTCLYNFDPLKPHFYIVKLGFTEIHIIFLISAYKKNIDCVYLLEPPRGGGSNEYTQSMF